ncbi:hypothetical protein [Notoacmeibacter sp. MSK16QG-6]|uniref:hypothetical protein n=1 Tax=Notoacmeibacter sp. MSK16QG-6 TaxID=2957982 RepID=UPI00209CE873|nr:hypothetical protein [Notoacmeibacter sp. MSK16QG-6]MCP1198017.1 hypothetical protein [Notoacmeibacter sp. MSK16QG-6]
MALEIVEAVQAAKRCEDAARRNEGRVATSDWGIQLTPKYKSIAHPAVSGAVAGRCTAKSGRSN